jgi:hypothetical protein
LIVRGARRRREAREAQQQAAQRQMGKAKRKSDERCDDDMPIRPLVASSSQMPGNGVGSHSRTGVMPPVVGRQAAVPSSYHQLAGQVGYYVHPQHLPPNKKHQTSGSSSAASAAAALLAAKAQQVSKSVQNVAAHLRMLDPTFDHRAVASVLKKVQDSMMSGEIEDEDDALARAVELITQHMPPAINVNPAVPSAPSGLSKEEQEAVETERRDMDLATEMALSSAADERAKRSKDERRELLAADLMDEGKLKDTGLVDCVVLGGLRKVGSFDYLCKATVGLQESAQVGTEAKAKIMLISLCQLAAKCRKWWGTDAVPYIKEMSEQVRNPPSPSPSSLTLNAFLL